MRDRATVILVVATTWLTAACGEPITWPTPAEPEAAGVCYLAPMPAQSLPLSGWFAEAAKGPAETRVSLTVRPTVRHQRAALAIEMRNVSDRPIELWPYQLPWGYAYALDVVGIETDGTSLERRCPIDDPAPTRHIVLAPGATLSGVNELPTVDDLDMRLLEHDVILLWHYRLPLDHAGSTTGVVTFPRRFHLRP
jgi:hypothetical protein